MAVNHNPNLVTDGIIGYWDVGNRTSYDGSSTTCFDLVGASDGTLTNSPTFNSGNMGSITFDGADDYISTPSAEHATFNVGANGLTVGVWSKLTGSGESPMRLVGKESAASLTTLDGWAFCVNNSESKPLSLKASVGLDSTNSLAQSNEVVTVSGWQYSVMVYNEDSDNKTKLYLNGEQLTSLDTDTAGVGSLTNNSYGPHIGNIANGTTKTFMGYIAMVHCYSRALTTNEVAQNFNATKGRFGL